MARVPAQPARVLVIDDDPVMRELLEALLSAENYTTEAVESGESAIAHLHASFAANIVLTDLQLPGLSGTALAAQLRAACPGARLLAMSGSEPAARDRAAFDAFLPKPFSMEDFAAALPAALPRARTQPQAPLPPHPAAPEPFDQSALDGATYDRLAASLPPSRLAELYQLTLDDVSARLALMRDALAALDITAFRREAHALKGGCGMVGALELASLAARAEAGSSGDTPGLEEFSAAAERLRSIMAARPKARN